jgi:predicted nucleic acid-binding protein
VLSKTEVIAGMRPLDERSSRALIDAIIWVEVSNSIAEAAGSFARTHLRTHPGIDVVDFVVAATKDDLGVPLWTLNVRHFPMFPNLAAPY